MTEMVPLVRLLVVDWRQQAVPQVSLGGVWRGCPSSGRRVAPQRRMRKWLLGAVCAALIIATSQSARAFEDGRALLKAANSESEVQYYGFVMYVAGVVAGALNIRTRWIVLGKVSRDLVRPICIPQKITYRDVGDVVRVWLRSHPELQGLPSGSVIVEALVERFPCK